MSETCQNLGWLLVVLPWLCALSVSNRLVDKGLAWCVMVGAVLFELFAFLTPLILGNLGYLSATTFRWCLWIFSGVVAGIGITRLPCVVRALRVARYRPHYEDIPLGIALYFAWCLVTHDFSVNWTDGPANFDSQNYHIPRALMWLWHGSFAPFRTSIWQQLAHAYGGSASVVTPIFYGCGWLGAAFNSQVYSIGGAAAIHVIGRALGLSWRGSLAAALAFLSFPAIGLRLAEVNTDVAAAFPVLAGTALFLAADSLPQGLFRFMALVGLGTACKQYVAFPALPIGIALVAPHFRQLRSVRVIGSTLTGFVAGVSFCALSFFPIYQAFGDLTGGGAAHGLSTWNGGYQAMLQATGHTFANWSMDTFASLPRDAWTKIFGDPERVAYLKSLTIEVPVLDQEHNRSGFLPLLLLPWLLLGVQKGQRLLATVIFFAVCVSQFSMLSINHVGARFAIIPLSAFALVWGARATSRGGARSALQACLAIALIAFGLRETRWRLSNWHMLSDRYYPEREPNRELAPVIGDDTLLVLSYELSVDGIIAGRRGSLRFEYVNCPVDGDWVRELSEYRKSYRWFLFSTAGQTTFAGPMFESKAGPACKESVTIDQIRSWLRAAGWVYEMPAMVTYELWRSP